MTDSSAHPMRALIAGAAAAVLAVALALPSTAAAAYVAFRTPSGNIGCAFSGPQGKQVRCDILRLDTTVPKRPRSCQGDYGHAFSVTPRGRARRDCVSDTVIDQGARVLAYGSSTRRYGIRCSSRQSGLRCVNRRGHGFALSRSAQKLF